MIYLQQSNMGNMRIRRVILEVAHSVIGTSVGQRGSDNTRTECEERVAITSVPFARVLHLHPFLSVRQIENWTETKTIKD